MALFSFPSGKTISAHKEHLIAFRGGLQMASAMSGFFPLTWWRRLKKSAEAGRKV
jgi:hypothetical protein